MIAHSGCLRSGSSGSAAFCWRAAASCTAFLIASWACWWARSASSLAATARNLNMMIGAAITPAHTSNPMAPKTTSPTSRTTREREGGRGSGAESGGVVIPSGYRSERAGKIPIKPQEGAVR